MKRRLARAARLSPQGGFSLLEVLVAFTILVLSLATLLHAFGTGTRAAERSAQHTRAVLLAQSKMASLGVEEPIREGATRGTFEAGYVWRITVSPLEGALGEGAALAPYRGLSPESVERYVAEREALAIRGLPPPVHLLVAGSPHLIPGSAADPAPEFFYTVEARGATRSGVAVHKRAVVELAGPGDYRVLSWSEDPWRETAPPEAEPQ